MRARLSRKVVVFAATLLCIEFMDELVYGAHQAAWPLIRDDLRLTYGQIGLLLGVPTIFSNAIEPFLGILGDVWRRRVLVLGGGVLFAVALALTAASGGFWALMVATLLMYPASGAFVSLSQATLMDLEPARREQNMARWTLAGSVAVVLGPLMLAMSSRIGAGWRGVFALLAVGMLGLVIVAARQPYPDGDGAPGSVLPDLRRVLAGVVDAVRQLRRGVVVRWLVLLQMSDLLQDVLFGYLALYLVDIGRVTPAEAGLGLAVWSAFGLLGDLLVIPMLERIEGLRVVRWSAAVSLIIYPLFLLAPDWRTQLVMLALLGVCRIGWYAVLQAQLYETLPGQSGAALAVSNLGGLLGGLIPVALGVVAQRAGLTVTMWLLLLGPVALLLGVPRSESREM